MCLRFKNEKVSIAVVGIRASGKSYLLSDIITSLGNLGYQRFDTQSGSYASIGNYKAKTRTDGKLSQTEMYACRPGENIYGATYKGHGKKIDVDFVDIPGEVFNGAKEVNNNTYLTVFTSYRHALLKLSKKLFTVTTWENGGGLRQLIVEPIVSAKRQEELDKYKQGNEYFDQQQFKKNRASAFQGWGTIYSWLKANGYEEHKSIKERALRKFGKTKISGKELLDNFFSYQPDSLMCSLSELVEQICPGLDISRTDFESGHNREAFYFLYYCSKATDIILCDRLFVPGSNGECQLDSDANYQKYDTITNELYSFIQGNNTKVYLAFRGVDYMLNAQKEHYKKLIDLLKQDGKSLDIIRNVTYSIFAYLLWNHIDDKANCAKDNDVFQDLVGLPDGNLEKEKAAGLFIDLTCNSAKHEVRLEQIIPQHVGGGAGDAFRQLLLASYGYEGPDPTDPMQMMPPHTYFTCTPVTADFEVYVNDPQSDNKRFIHPENCNGPAKYFDTAGSNFCFGTYQLCVDILSQHGVDVHGWSKFGELINTSIRK